MLSLLGVSREEGNIFWGLGLGVVGKKGIRHIGIIFSYSLLRASKLDIASKRTQT